MAKATRRRSKTRVSKRVKAAADKFTADLIARGEAVEPDASGKVPRHATHVLTHDPAGNPVVRRVKFKTF
jgi:hypothetical protein